MTVFRPDHPLWTERLLLRPFAESDFEAVAAMDGDADIARYLYWRPRTRSQARLALARRVRMTTIAKEGDGIRLAAVLRDDGALVGDLSLRYVSREHGLGEIGFVVHPAYHGKGYATEAARVMLALGFDGLRLHRIIGRCDGRNLASARVMERLGMRREAHFRENEFIKGEWTDELVYAMLAEEWLGAGG